MLGLLNCCIKRVFLLLFCVFFFLSSFFLIVAFLLFFAVVSVLNKERPPPPENLRAINVQTRYIILAWDKPQYGSNYQISNYTIRKKKTSDNFTEVQTLPRTRTGIMMKNLEPDTEYTITLSSNNKYGRSDDALLTQRTLPGKC